MKSIRTVTVTFFIFCMSFTAFCPGVWAQTANMTSEQKDPSVAWPEISAASAVVLDGKTGRVLYEKNAQEKQYMASTTKIMTCLLALEDMKDKHEMITVSEYAASQEGSSIYMEPGEKISFEDLIYALMLRSGNDAAVALAEWAAGSEEAFAEKMNERAQEMGLEHTHFVTASGLHHEEHYTTARDLGQLAFDAMKNPDFRNIVATPSWNASREVDKLNYFYNKNKVLYQYEGGNGIKIGYTTAAGRCLVASSQRGDIQLICVVLSADNWFEDTYRLMDTVYENYEAVKVADADVPLKTIDVRNGEKSYTKLVARSDTQIPLTGAEKETLQIRYRLSEEVKAPVRRGEVLGKMEVYISGQKAGEIDLVAREDIDISQTAPAFFQIFS